MCDVEGVGVVVWEEPSVADVLFGTWVPMFYASVFCYRDGCLWSSVNRVELSKLCVLVRKNICTLNVLSRNVARLLSIRFTLSCETRGTSILGHVAVAVSLCIFHLSCWKGGNPSSFELFDLFDLKLCVWLFVFCPRVDFPCQ